jgi:hypothetical protein
VTSGPRKRGSGPTEREASEEGQRRRFIWLWLTAYEATRYVFEEKVDRFQFNNLAEQIIAGSVVRDVEECDDLEFRRNLLKKQADLLRATVSNPF